MGAQVNTSARIAEKHNRSLQQGQDESAPASEPPATQSVPENVKDDPRGNWGELLRPTYKGKGKERRSVGYALPSGVQAIPGEGDCRMDNKSGFEFNYSKDVKTGIKARNHSTSTTEDPDGNLLHKECKSVIDMDKLNGAEHKCASQHSALDDILHFDHYVPYSSSTRDPWDESEVPRYGSVCASWDAADEEPWCIVASSTACGVNATFSGMSGQYWAHAPCQGKSEYKPQGAPVQISFEEYLHAHSFTVMRFPNATAAGIKSSNVPRPSSTVSNFPGKAAYAKLGVGEQNRIRVRNLVAVSTALKAAGCVHHLNAGTLLGLTRNRNLIPHDSDDDIAVYGCANDASLSAIFAKLEPQGFTLCRSNKRLWSVCRHGAYIDLEHWQMDGRLCKYEDNWMVLPCSIVFPIVYSTTNQNGSRADRENWPVPFVPTAVLRVYYGKGWRVPSSFHAGRTSARASDAFARQHPAGTAQLAAALSQGFSLAL
eukprot:g1843.t1